jgi:predicted nuclease of restriction endonuclease-like (RecB) superfamily
MKSSKKEYNLLLEDIGQAIETARQNAVRAVNTELVKANWEIGRHIVKFEQHGQEKAEYGSDLLASLSRDLKLRYGKGFGRRNVLDMRRFYVSYPKWQTVSAKLSWSHFIVLLGVSDETTRKFYEKQAIHENWSKRELERQIDSSLFERLALSRDKKGILQLSEKGNIANHATQVIKRSLYT